MILVAVPPYISTMYHPYSGLHAVKYNPVSFSLVNVSVTGHAVSTSATQAYGSALKWREHISFCITKPLDELDIIFFVRRVPVGNIAINAERTVLNTRRTCNLITVQTPSISANFEPLRSIYYASRE